MASIRSREGEGGRIKKGKIGRRRKKREIWREVVSPKFGGKMAAIVGQNKETWMLLGSIS